MNYQNYTKYSGQEGVVSIFTVIFFIILTSIITIGFIRLVNVEQQQATDSSSSASALAAARSGIENGKRALLLAEKLKSSSDPNDMAVLGALETAFNGEQCDSIMGLSLAAAAIGLDYDSSNGGKVYQDGADGGQFITCLMIKPRTDDFQGVAKVGASVMVPLGDSSISFLEFSWHRPGADADGEISESSTVFNGNPGVDDLLNTASNSDLPSNIRLQLIGVPGSNIKPDNITSHTGFLNTASKPPAQPRIEANLSLQDDADLTETKNAPATAVCTSKFEYACIASVNLGTINSSYKYYLRVTAIHRQASFKVTMKDSSSNTVQFNGIQPVIDSTGKTGDTFRRIRARVSFASHVSLPEYVVEALGDPAVPGSGDLCKNMTINGISVTSSGC